MSAILDWYGCATFRLEVAGLVIYLDTFMDRAAGAPDVGMASEWVRQADFALIGHAHWDHLAGADVIAKAAGGTLGPLLSISSQMPDMPRPMDAPMVMSMRAKAADEPTPITAPTEQTVTAVVVGRWQFIPGAPR